jgi:predicted DNA-binding transcriptional regulator AlpA
MPSDTKPATLADDPVLRPRKIANLTGLNYSSVVSLIAAGAFGEKVVLGKRAIGVRSSAVEKWLADPNKQAIKGKMVQHADAGAPQAAA